MILKKGSKGEEVKELQEFLKNEGYYKGVIDGDFGTNTENSVKEWQKANSLNSDGVVGPNTIDTMGLFSTDNTEKVYEINNCSLIEQYYLPKGEYKIGPTSKEYLFLHHTAGWHNPYKVIDSWGRDSRGSIATEFVLGGQSVKGNSKKYDGQILQAFPGTGYGWHLGKNGSQHMHTHSVGVEVCNFGYIVDGKTYAGTIADESQIVSLNEKFRGYKFWHRYSDEQLNSLKNLILYIAERDNIDVRCGLVSEVKEHGTKGFEFNEDAYYGKVKGMWTHTNVRKDKFDMFPQQELIDMLLSL